MRHAWALRTSLCAVRLRAANLACFLCSSQQVLLYVGVVQTGRVVERRRAGASIATGLGGG